MLPDREGDEARLKPIADFTLRVSRPLCWHDAREPWPKRLVGATCFVLRFDGGLIGVTADHVVAAMDSARSKSSRFVALLRTAVLDWPEALIDRHQDLDIATFRVTEAQLSESGAIALDCRGVWPPPAISDGDPLTFAGYPEIIQVAASPEAYPFHGSVHLGRADSVTEGKVLTVFDPGRGDYRLRAAAPLPDVGGNFSGCSGGPVLLHVGEKAYPVGLIVEGPSGSPSGLFGNLDIYQCRRLHYIAPDGSIHR